MINVDPWPRNDTSPLSKILFPFTTRNIHYSSVSVSREGKEKDVLLVWESIHSRKYRATLLISIYFGSYGSLWGKIRAGLWLSLSYLMKTHGRCLWERAISCWLREFGRVPVNFRTCNSDALCILSTEFSMYVSRYLSRSPQISPTFRQKFLSSSYEERPFHTSYLVGMEIRIFCLARLLFAPLCIIRRRTCDFVPSFFASYYYAMFPLRKRKGDIQ